MKEGEITKEEAANSALAEKIAEITTEREQEKHELEEAATKIQR